MGAGPPERYKPEQIIAALEEADGFVSAAASILRCSAGTIYNYRDRYTAVAEAWENIRERRHDVAEKLLWRRMLADDTTAIIFYLRTQGRARGYGQRTDHVLLTAADLQQLSDAALEEIANGRMPQQLADGGKIIQGELISGDQATGSAAQDSPEDAPEA